MKKFFIISILVLMPFLALAEPMLRPVEENVNEEVIIKENINTNSSEGEEIIVVSVNVDLPDLKWVPSTPLYFLKTWWEKARGWFMIDPVKKAKYRIDLANKRLEEIEVLAQKKKTEVITETTERFNAEMAKANEYIAKAQEKGKDLEGIYRLLDENRVRHQMTFSKIDKMIPEEVKSLVEQTKQDSLNSFEAAKDKIKDKTKDGLMDGIDMLQDKLEDTL